jgi:hypothetical protein
MPLDLFLVVADRFDRSQVTIEVAQQPRPNVNRIASGIEPQSPEPGIDVAALLLQFMKSPNNRC